ncbi:FAD-dependent oxidoreductase [Amycolatopsis sp. NPDC004368]
MSVIIIGAGMGGLSLAQGLRKAGVPFEIYERDAALDARPQGYRLHIDSVGNDALRAVLPHNLYELFRATAQQVLARNVVYDEKLRHVEDLPLVGRDPHLNVNRFTVRQILQHGLRINFGKRFTHYEADGDGVTAHFTDGTSARGELLVGADGVNSPVRRQYLPHAEVVDFGLGSFYTRVPLTEQSRRLFTPEAFKVFSLAVAPDNTLIGFGSVDYPEPVAEAAARLVPDLDLRDHDPYMSFSFSAPQDIFALSEGEAAALSGAEMREVALDRLAGFAPEIRAMVEHWDDDSTFPLKVRTSVPVDPWETTRVTVMGDAIHTMSPAAGAGANTALRDGATLSAELASSLRLDAVAKYESAMVRYGFDAVRHSASNGARSFGQPALPPVSSFQ